MPTSRRINIQHRVVYQVLEDEQVVKLLGWRGPGLFEGQGDEAAVVGRREIA